MESCIVCHEHGHVQRVSPATLAGQSHGRYRPLGGGARQCIGVGFAWMEGPLALATLAQQWQPRLVQAISSLSNLLLPWAPNRYAGDSCKAPSASGIAPSPLTA